VIAAATEAHHGLAAQVIDAGLPLLVEKPLCPSLEQSQELVDASAAAGTPLMCGFLERFNPAVMTAMKMVEAPLYVRAQRHSPYASRIKTGVAWDLLVHDVDLVVRAFGGEQPESFDVKVGQFHPESVEGAEDIVEAGVRFSGGGIASVSASRLGQVKVRSMVIQELDRMIEIDLLRRGLTSYRHSSIEADDDFVGFRQFTEIEVPEIGGAEPLVSQLAHFVDLVEGTVDLDAERASILPAHSVVDEVLRTR
jgi:predicted dehydrogenase